MARPSLGERSTPADETPPGRTRYTAPALLVWICRASPTYLEAVAFQRLNPAIGLAALVAVFGILIVGRERTSGATIGDPGQNLTALRFANEASPQALDAPVALGFEAPHLTATEVASAATVRGS